MILFIIIMKVYRSIVNILFQKNIFFMAFSRNFRMNSEKAYRFLRNR